jgi:hypothetical protein
MGHPTPWTEGFVVRFSNEDGTEWVGNFQHGWTNFDLAAELPYSKLVAVISHGALYLLPSSHPDPITPGEVGVSGAAIGESGLLIVAVYDVVYASDHNGSVAWRRGDFAEEVVALLSCVSGVVELQIEDWQGTRRTVRVAELDGTDLL